MRYGICGVSGVCGLLLLAACAETPVQKDPPATGEKAPAAAMSAECAAALAPTDSPPDQLSRDQIKCTMANARPAAQACFQRFGASGAALVAVVIAPDGSVSSADTKGALAGSPPGACIADAIRQARFPQFTGAPMSITYPYVGR